jgi:hypothetical protein
VASHEVTLAGLQLATFGLGAGMGFANIALLIAVQESVDFSRRGVATATNVFFRMIGGTVAVGALGVLVAHAVRDQVSPKILADLLGPTHGQLLAPELLGSASAAMQRGMLPVFGVVALLGGLSAIAGMTFPRVSAPSARSGASSAG